MNKITVSIDEQILRAYEGDILKYEFICVTGDSGHPTPTGEFHIFRKEHPYRSKEFDVEMDHAMFFSEGKAIHQYHGYAPLSVVRAVKQKVTDWFGSHGCVRIEKEAAATMFEWASINTRVSIS